LNDNELELTGRWEGRADSHGTDRLPDRGPPPSPSSSAARRSTAAKDNPRWKWVKGVAPGTGCGIESLTELAGSLYLLSFPTVYKRHGHICYRVITQLQGARLAITHWPVCLADRRFTIIAWTPRCAV